MHLETERLVIRPWQRAEAERLYDVWRRPEVVRWFGMPNGEPVAPMRSVDEAHQRLARWHARSRTPPLGAWALELRDTGVVAGTGMLVRAPDDDGVEVGWHLHPDCWGHGYATEAGRALIDHGFAHGLDLIHAAVHRDNAPSHAVCERLRMEPTGDQGWYVGPWRYYEISATSR